MQIRGGLDGTALFERSTSKPIRYDFLLPDRHGSRYYYQKLLLNVPFRGVAVSDFLYPSSGASRNNVSRSLAEECRLRKRPDGSPVLEHDMKVQIQKDAEMRLFTPETIQTMQNM